MYNKIIKLTLSYELLQCISSPVVLHLASMPFRELAPPIRCVPLLYIIYLLTTLFIFTRPNTGRFYNIIYLSKTLFFQNLTLDHPDFVHVLMHVVKPNTRHGG